MKAMLLNRLCPIQDNSVPLQLAQLPVPKPAPNELLVRVSACGVCHTELDEIEGRTPPTELPVVPGHQVIGRIEALGHGATRFQIDDRVGIAWIHSACGECPLCRAGNENLCPNFRATGRDVNGGYAQYTTVPNVTRADVSQFLALAAQIDIRPEVEEFALQDANQALLELKTKRTRGAKVLIVD